jgi:hypothetical protein
LTYAGKGNGALAPLAGDKETVRLSRRGSWLDLLIQTFEGGGPNWGARLTGLYTFLIAANLGA